MHIRRIGHIGDGGVDIPAASWLWGGQKTRPRMVAACTALEHAAQTSQAGNITAAAKIVEDTRSERLGPNVRYVGVSSDVHEGD